MVTIRATIDVSGFPKGERVTVAETPRVAGAIRNGVFELIERYPAVSPETSHEGETDPETDDETSQPETLLGVSQPLPETDETFCKCMDQECTNRHYQDFLDEQAAAAEVAADNSTVTPSHLPGTRKRRG